MKLKGLRLKNRITMAPLYLGYAAYGGTISPLLLYHYKLMAQSGAAMIVVENASITAGGSGSPRTIRCDHNRYLPGLEKLAAAIKDQKTGLHGSACRGRQKKREVAGDCGRQNLHSGQGGIHPESRKSGPCRIGTRLVD